jgi:DNA-binding transcriptional MerR regulator
MYKHSDEVRLGFIRTAKDLGFSLTEIRQILEESEKGNSPCPLVRDFVKFNIKINADKIERLAALQNKMQVAQKMWKGMTDSMPDGHSVCHLIEAFAE